MVSNTTLTPTPGACRSCVRSSRSITLQTVRPGNIKVRKMVGSGTTPRGHQGFIISTVHDVPLLVLAIFRFRFDLYRRGKDGKMFVTMNIVILVVDFILVILSFRFIADQLLDSVKCRPWYGKHHWFVFHIADHERSRRWWRWRYTSCLWLWSWFWLVVRNGFRLKPHLRFMTKNARLKFRNPEHGDIGVALL